MHPIEYSPSPIPSLAEVGIPITSEIREEMEELIPGLLPLKGQLVIAGETNIGKSLSALEITSSLITGEPLWGELTPNKTVNKVLYCLGEHYAEIIMRLAKLTKLPFTDQVIIVGPEQLLWDKWLVSHGTINLQSFNKLDKWLEGVGLVVFDPLAAFISGEAAENDNVQMRLVLQTMNDLAHKAGASCLVLAHQGKPIIDKFGEEHSRKSYAIRGASAVEDAATNIFYLGRAEGSSGAAQRNDMEIYSLKKRKYKGSAPDEYRLLRDSSTLCHTLLGNRPFVEVHRIATQAKVGKLQAAFPNMPFDEVIRAVAVMNDQSVTTIKRYLGLVK